MFNRLKDSILEVLKSRLFVLIVVFCILSAILIQRVFYLQIVKGEDYLNNYKLKIQKTKTIQGTRGVIYDRNGEVLATNKLAYSVQIEDNGSYEDTKQKNKLINKTINSVIDMVEKNGDSIVNDFGIILNSNNEYEFLYSEGTRRLRFLADIYGYTTIDKLSEDEKNSTPQEVMDFLCANKRGKSWGFGIDQEKYEEKYGKSRVLQLVTIRYGMHLNSFQKYIPTTIASDVSDQTVAVIMENLSDLQGISIGEESLREYPDSKYFSSILGYTGKISQEEYDDLSEEQQKSYSLTEIVGKSGIEQTMDEYLQGEKGKETVYVDSVGKVIESKKDKEPKAGNNLYLSIDKNLQITAYNLIEEKLAGIILKKMTTALDYTRDPEGNSDIIIPVGDIYNAFFANEILDIDHFATSEAQATEQEVYAAYSQRLDTAINEIITELQSSSAEPYEDLSKEMQAYMNYIEADLLTSKTEIIMKDKIDTNDETYKAWKTDESISLKEYLNYAISKNWIDTSVIQDYVSSDEKYSNAGELYQGILTFINDYLKTDSNFEKLIYQYMIKDGTLRGSQVCMLLYEQNVLPLDEQQDQYNRLASGSISAYDFIRSKIESLEITPGQLGVEPSTGSFVMTEVATGKTLALVSYPGYDNNRLANTMDSDYYNKLYVDLSQPFYNKATQETTAPGSTYKMVSSAAGLSEGIITGSTTIGCYGPYKNITPSPKCWIYPGGHGNLTVTGALAHSCNNFFFDVGYRLGLSSEGNYSSDVGTDKLAKYAEMFGLGETSGLEIPESEPRISDEDAVRSAIGQGTNLFTTSQLAKYVTAIANRGTVYDLTLLSKIEDVDGNLVKEFEPTLYKQIEKSEISSTSFNLIQQGMEQMVERDSRFKSVRDGGIKMAGKTGTAQHSKAHADHVLFVGYAPADQPEIAVSARIAYGYNSGYPAEIGRDMVRKYFNLADDADLVTGTASSLGSEIRGD